MKQKIGRTLCWLKDENGDVGDFVSRFFGISTFLNQLLNEKYSGIAIKFINIELGNQARFDKFPITPPDSVHYVKRAGANLFYYNLIEFDAFNSINFKDQCRLVWDVACSSLVKAGVKTKNVELSQAAEFAHQKGLELDLKADICVLETTVILHTTTVNASIWVLIDEFEMTARFRLQKEMEIILEKEIDKCGNVGEFFLEMFKSITTAGTQLIIKTVKDAPGNYPMRIEIPARLLA